MKIPKLPFDIQGLFEGLGRVFSFSRREILILSVSGAAVLIAAVIIIVISALVSGGDRRTESAFETAGASPLTVPVSERPFLSDFIIYEDKIQESFTGIIYSREPQDSWSEEMVRKYWIDPESIAEDQLKLDADKIIRDIFADVP